MKAKHGYLTKALSVILTAVMLLATVSVGFVLPETRITADAATYNVNSLSAINTAIGNANAAGADTQTIIKLSGAITAGETAGLTAITGNVLFDFNGYNITVDYQKDGAENVDSDVYEYQSPSELQTSGGAKDYVTKGILNVADGGTLQIINSASTDAEFKVHSYYYEKDSTARHLTGSRAKTTYTTTASIVYSEGALLIGENNSSNNNFTLRAEARSRTNDNGYDQRNMAANAYAVTVNGSNAKFYMYGGNVFASCNTRASYKGHHDVRCFALNINNCYCAELYGGTIQVPNKCNGNTTGVEQASGEDCTGGTTYFAALRVNCPNVFVFYSTLLTQIYVDENTGSSVNNTACIYVPNDNALPNIYGAGCAPSSALLFRFPALHRPAGR